MFLISRFLMVKVPEARYLLMMRRAVGTLIANFFAAFLTLRCSLSMS